MSLPVDTNKRNLIAGYVKEAVANLEQQDLAKVRLAEIKETVKESELIDMKEFNSAVAAAYDIEKHQNKIDTLQSGIDIIEMLNI